MCVPRQSLCARHDRQHDLHRWRIQHSGVSEMSQAILNPEQLLSQRRQGHPAGNAGDQHRLPGVSWRAELHHIVKPTTSLTWLFLGGPLVLLSRKLGGLAA